MKRNIQLTHTQVCDLSSELNESSTSTFKVESAHKKKVARLEL